MKECKHLGYACGEYFCKLKDDVDDLKDNKLFCEGCPDYETDMKPKPLDLEDLKDFAPNEVAKQIMSMMVYGLYKEEKIVDTKEEAIELAQDLLTEILDEVKQRIKQACEFWLRYRNRPILLWKEHPEYRKELEEKFDIFKLDVWYDWEGVGYNEWLFKLAFNLEEVKQDEG